MAERAPAEGREAGPEGSAGWLAALAAAAAREGVALDAATSRDGVLTVDVRGDGGDAVRVDVLPAAAGERYYLRAGRHGLRHHGAARPSAAQEAALGALARALVAVEGRIPRGLVIAPGAAAAGGAPLVTIERSESAGSGEVWTELLVRVTARCNQACPFCSAPPPHPDADAAALRGWLERELPRHPRPTVTLTGGEPTLWAGLPELVGLLVDHPGVVLVKVQTNAVGFASAERLRAYPAHPRLVFFVSLHGAVPEVYDACTGTEGQLEPARRGVANLLAAAHPVTLNLVVTRHNVAHLDAWVDAVQAWFGAAPGLRLHLSVMTCPEHRAGAPDALVPYREATPRLVAAVRRAREAGLACDPLLASSHASAPPCLLPGDERLRGSRGDGREARPLHGAARTPGASAVGWVKAARCAGCAEEAWCLGLPRAYADRFGLDELSPIS